MSIEDKIDVELEAIQGRIETTRKSLDYLRRNSMTKHQVALQGSLSELATIPIGVEVKLITDGTDHPTV